MADHRQNYSVLKLLVNGGRMLDDYTEDDAVSDYLKLHPEADEAEVRAELKRELASLSPA